MPDQKVHCIVFGGQRLGHVRNTQVQRQLLVRKVLAEALQVGIALIQQSARRYVRLDGGTHARQQAVGIVGTVEQLLHLATHAARGHRLVERRRVERQVAGFFVRHHP
ncbi:hypothetical protein D3C78_1708830 [compost metagenome]